jgi:hypothetical protein
VVLEDGQAGLGFAAVFEGGAAIFGLFEEGEVSAYRVIGGLDAGNR